jgi:hypothetical protein
MNKAFISALNDLLSLEFGQFARQVEKILLPTIQSNISNAVSAKVTSFLSTNKGASTIVFVNITVIDHIKIFPVVHAVEVQSVLEGGISSGKLTPLNISQIYVTG